MPDEANERTVLTVDAADAGQRLDRVLVARLADLSRSRLQGLIRAGNVSIGAKPAVNPGQRLKAGEVIAVTIPPPEPAKPEAQDIPLTVIYEDAHLIVIDKPKGLAVHPAPGHASGTLVNALIAHCGASLSGIGGVKRPGIVHRLDKDTTGLLVAAKTDKAHHGLAAQFAAHGADGRRERAYQVIVWGALPRVRGKIDAALARSTANRTKIAVVPEARGRRAVTHYEVLERFAPGSTARAEPLASLLRLVLETGRTHQIRVHLAHAGHPLLGDAAYGAGYRASARKLSPAGQAALAALDRQALHAAELAFVHPVTGKRLKFASPLPPDMAKLAHELRKA